VEIKIAPAALAEKLTMAGLEVTALEERGGDFIFEIEVTANRPDYLSVIGIAREVAAITGRKLKIVTTSPRHHVTSKALIIEIEDKKDCPLYTAKIINGVKVGPSPEWLSKRLELVGCRSVNNIVDITNYILFTYGEPLHAFDLDKLVSPLAGYPVIPLEIIVRRARQGEKIITIDGIERLLDENILVIASGLNRRTGEQANRRTDMPIALAGIMGGQDTEVSAVTKNILLEAAIFNPVTIRRGRQKLGLQSESSYRFERGIDAASVTSASAAAAEMMQELAGGICVAQEASGLQKPVKKSLRLDISGVSQTLGVNIPAAKIKSILNSLDFKVKAAAKNTFSVEVPARRSDVNLEIDLVEEIARIYAYGSIPETLPAAPLQAARNGERELVAFIKEALVGLGLNEVITYSLIAESWLNDAAFASAAEPIAILNPLSKEQEILRPALLPSLLRCVAYNLNQKQNYINIFEIAKIFSRANGQVNEELTLGIALCGAKPLLLRGGLVREEASFLHLKGILEILFERLGTRDYQFKADGAAQIGVFAGQQRVGSLRQPQKPALEKFEIKNKDVFLLEISLEKFFSAVNLQKRLVPLAVYPAISRDISLVLQEGIPAEDVLGAIKAQGGPLLREVKIIDYYKGKQIPSGHKSLTVSCVYRSDERTLTETEVNPLQAAVVDALTQKFNAQIR